MAMTLEALRDEYARIVAEDGPWTAHSIQLGQGLETMPGQRHAFEEYRAGLAMRFARLLLQKPPSDVRVLDIGALEGGIAIALGRMGCDVVGLEIREPSLRKARYAARALNLDNVRFVQGDMLALDRLDLGRFDLVICAGTLYHVDAPDIVPFLRVMNRLCDGIAFFDTHICVRPTETFAATGTLDLLGESYVEHLGPDDKKEQRLWASARNDHSFVLTERSLGNALLEAGWSQAFRPLAPILEWPWVDRGYWIAVGSSHAEGLGLTTPQHYLADPAPETPSPLLSNPKRLSVPNPATRPR